MQFYVVYPDTQLAKASTLLTQSNIEKSKYTFKDRNDPTLTILTDQKTGKTQYLYAGYLTFTDDASADSFKTTVFSLIDSKDVVYALVYYLGNTHQYKNPLPDVILEKIEVGDACAVFDSLPC